MPNKSVETINDKVNWTHAGRKKCPWKNQGELEVNGLSL